MNQVVNIGLIGLNHVGRVFCDYAGSVFIQSAVLVSVLLVMDWFVRKRVRAVFRYCVWMLVLVKLVLPPSLALPTGIGYWLGDRLPAAFPVSDRAGHTTGLDPANQYPSPGSPLSRETPQVQPPTKASEKEGSIAPAVSGMTPITWQGILFLLWFVGVLVFAALLVQRLRFVKGLIAFSSPTDTRFKTIMEECGRQVGIHREIGLRASDTMSSPAICGLLKPIVLVPARILETLSPDGLKAILIHELAHMKRGDLWVNTLQTVLQVIHFYNPFVWLANTLIRRTREEAVDETVLVALGGQAKDYSNTLIDIGEMVLWKADLGLRLIGVAESEKILRWRIKHMLTRPIPKSAKLGVKGTMVLVVMAAILLPMACVQRPNPGATAPSQATRTNMPGEDSVAGESDVFVDPNTGIRFTKFKTLFGPSDVIKSAWSVSLSPNGKFLLDGVRVVPLDGRAPFDLVDMPGAGGQGSLSPDGRKVVFFCAEALWLIEVDPDTGRPTGSPRRLLDRQIYVTGGWSRDSQRIMFLRKDGQPGDAAIWRWWTLGLESGAPSPLVDPFSFGLLSPDGKTVAYLDRASTDGSPHSSSLLLKPTAGGEARKILDVATPLSPVAWSGDGEWLLCGAGRRLEFIRIADGHEAEVATPWSMIPQQYPQGGKLLLYQSSYEDKAALKVVSVAGGPPTEFGWPNLTFVNESWSTFPSWANDSHSILVAGQRGEDKWRLWAVPLDGMAPGPLMIDTPMCRDAFARLFSPDNNKLLFCVGGGPGPWDVWTVPISLTQMTSTGPAVKVFGGMVPPVRSPEAFLDSWSPDGSKIAVIHNWDIWVVDADGKNTLQLTKTPEMEGWPMWSPDGKMIAFFTQPSDLTQVGTQEIHLRVHVVPASGGEAKVIADLKHVLMGGAQRYVWHPDGKEVTVACEEDGIIANFPIAGGDRRTVVHLKDLGFERASWLRWSPDGKFLAFVGGSSQDMKLCVYQPSTAKLQGLTDQGVAPFYWSPDSKWISYFSSGAVKTRPEGVLWELDVDEAVAKLAK